MIFLRLDGWVISHYLTVADNYIILVSSCEEFNSNHVSLFIRIQNSIGQARSAELLGERRRRDFYGGLAPWTADGSLGEPGEEENGRMRELQEKDEKSDDEMKWLKKARLFELPRRTYGWMVSHAAVPYAECLRDSRYRVYFSARDRYNRARTGFFDFDLQHPTKILGTSKNPILDLGRLGAFDDSGAMLSWITNYENKKYFSISDGTWASQLLFEMPSALPSLTAQVKRCARFRRALSSTETSTTHISFPIPVCSSMAEFGECGTCLAASGNWKPANPSTGTTSVMRNPQTESIGEKPESSVLIFSQEANMPFPGLVS